MNNIKIFENTLLLDLLVEDGVCYGVRCWSENRELQSAEGGSEVLIYADHVFLTSGGASAIYALQLPS